MPKNLMMYVNKTTTTTITKEMFDNDQFFNTLRQKEYARLDELNHVYLDYTGGNLHPKSLVDHHYAYLQNEVYGNPHSMNPTSLQSEKSVREARQKVIDFFNAQDYHCIFTPNATGGLKIIGECYPFSSESHLLLTADNHNSVNGIREYCREKGGHPSYTTLNFADLTLNESVLKNKLSNLGGRKNNLFAFPAQSNVSGVQHSLEWIDKAQEQNWDVLLDAAAYVPTSKLDLMKFRPDFVVLSFYKIFGYPTGLGCLLIKKSKLSKLKKPWFAGGTVTLSSVRHDDHFLKQGHEKYENGTINYLDIPAISYGLDFIASISMDKIERRIRQLSLLVLSGLRELRHNNGRPLVKLYGPQGIAHRGGTFIINFFDISGRQYPPQHIELMANAEKISLRTGCFCNPGVDETNCDISAGELKKYFSNRENGDYEDVVRSMRRLRGAVRMSIGIPTVHNDIKKFMRFAKKLRNKSVSKNMTGIPADLLYS